MINKIKYLFLNVFLTLLILEVFLRIYGFIYIRRVSSLYKNKTDSYKLKILAVGESTTGGLWIEDKSYPLQLQKKLNDYYQCNSCVKVDIMSLPGANTSMNLYHYPQTLLEVKPDIVIFMTGVNDPAFFAYNLDVLTLENFFYKNKLIYKIYRKTIGLLNQLRIVRLGKLICSNLFLINEKSNDLEKNFTESLAKRRNGFASKNYPFISQSTKENIRKMIEITKMNGIKPVLMTYHTALANRIIREISKEQRVLLINNEILFRNKNLKDYVFSKDNWHPNEKGYELIADNVFRFLIDNKLIPNEK